MAYTTKRDMKTLEAVREILASRRDSLTPPELMAQSEFCTYVEKLQAESEKATSNARESMRKYRSTPEGLEKSRKTTRESTARWREKKKAEKA